MFVYIKRNIFLVSRERERERMRKYLSRHFMMKRSLCSSKQKKKKETTGTLKLLKKIDY